jgi:cytochrome P450
MLQMLKQSREQGPVFRSDLYGGFWVVTSLELIRSIYRDTATFSSARDSAGGGGVFIPPFPSPIGLLPGEADRPYNDTLRDAVMPWFRREAIVAARPRIQRIADSTVETILECGSFDVVADLGTVVPATFIVEYLGFPPEQLPGFSSTLRASQQSPAEAAGALETMGRAVLELVNEKRGAPCDDVASHLIRNQAQLSDPEFVSILSNLLFGGIETSSAAIANTLLYLEHRRDVRQQLIEAPQAIPRAIAEIFRYFTPILHSARTVLQDTELGGCRLATGDRVLLCLQAANHDDTAFDHADELQIERDQHVDVAFGFGPHRCLGIHLGKTQLEIMLATVLAKLPDYEIDIERTRRSEDPGTFNAWTTMPARVNAPARTF